MNEKRTAGGDLVRQGESDGSGELAGGEEKNVALQRGATPCNIFQSLVPGLDPKELQHRKLSPKQMAAMHLLLQGTSDSQVAQQLETSRQTIFRWRTGNEVFAAELDARRRGMWQHTADRLIAMVTPALDVLQRQLADAQTASDSKVATQVASTVLRLAMRHRPVEPLKPELLRRERRRAFDAALDTFINAPLPGELQRDKISSAATVRSVVCKNSVKGDRPVNI